MANITWGNPQASSHPDQGMYQGAQTQPGQYTHPAHAPQGGYAPHPTAQAPQQQHAQPAPQETPRGFSIQRMAVHPAHMSEQEQQYYGQTQAAGYGAPQHAPAQQQFAQQQFSQPQFTQTQPELHGAAPTGHATTPPASGGFVSPRFANLMNYSGAALSLALIVGLGVWSYNLAVRDVTGIPVVRALEGPMRVQPENPGGQAAAHQGLAVNDVQSGGGARAPADRLALAPAPASLGDDSAPVVAAAQTPQFTEAAQPAPAPVAPNVNDPVAAALALAEQVSQGVTPLTSGDAQVTRAALQTPLTTPVVAPRPAVVAPAVISASIPGVRLSPRPPVRPAFVPRTAPNPASVQAQVQAALQVPAATAANEVNPNDVPTGTRLVQLGAFDSAEVARAEWNKLSVRFEDYIPGKTRVIQKAKSGGKIFYRLRAMGFRDLADARRFCSALMAGKTACIPVITR